jgi:succinate-semialdehyde dehydrogenase/glutarate-semialdehyde dehydrogenase
MPQYPEIKMLIGGEWLSRPGSPIINPADESILGTVPHADDADLTRAIDCAREGFEVWRKTSPSNRATIMLRAAEILRSRVDEIAHATTLEQGKPLSQARTDLQRCADMVEWDAQEGRRIYGRIVAGEPGMSHQIIHQPIGIVAGFAPWNFPVTSSGRKIAAALAAGCSIIIKPPEEAPSGGVHLAQAFTEAGLPPGVLNVVYGSPSEISGKLIPHPAVRLVTFTGSVPVGKQLAAMAGAAMKPAIMELGGHAPVLVCDDVDIAEVAAQSVLAKARNAGQICNSPTRFYVEENVFPDFVDIFVAKAKTLQVGSGLDPSTEMGPLANTRRMDAMQELVADAVGKGARLLSGGSRIGNRGYYFPFTVLADVPDDARVMSEEPFGPLALINPVRNLDEAIEKANALPYGLAGFAFTHSAPKVHRISDRLEVGTLAINHFVVSKPETPFGGIKDSGYGREGGIEGIVSYTVTKNIAHLAQA